MADCTFLEQSFSHFIPELAGSIISTVLISIGLLFTDWRMALAALWVLPVAFAIVGDVYKRQLSGITAPGNPLFHAVSAAWRSAVGRLSGTERNTVRKTG